MHPLILAGIRSRWSKGGLPRFELIVAILFCIALIPTLRNITGSNDINIFYKAAETLRSGKSMYAQPLLQGMWYYYSPLFASVLVPFTFFPIQVIKLIWLFLGFAMVFRIYGLFKYFFPIPDSKAGKVFVALIAACSVHAVFMNLLYGQLTILIVWCCMEGVYRTLRNQTWIGAFAFAIGINIKLLPGFFFYSYALKKNWKFILQIIAALVLLTAIPYLFFHPDFHNRLISDWISIINPLNDEHINTTGEGGFTDFASIITKYFTDLAISTEAQLNFVSLTEHEVFLIQNTFRFIVLAVTAWMILFVHRKLERPQIREFADLAFVLLCTIVAFPHQRDYSVMLAVPTFALVLYSYVVLGFRPGRLLTLCMALFAVGMGFLLFPQLLGYQVKYHFFEKRIPGLSTLVFIPLYISWMIKLGKARYFPQDS